jgi:phage terminase large subunit
VGIGVGVYDYMRGKGIEVTPYNAGSSPVTKQEFLSYKNKRAEDYWNLRDGLANGTVKLIYDEALFRELTNIRYFIKERFIQIESKQEIKKRLGYSPDRADAVCIATSIVEESTFNFIV